MSACAFCGRFHTAVNGPCPEYPQAFVTAPPLTSGNHIHALRATCEICELRAELSALRAAQPLTRAIEQIRELLKGDYEASYDLINDISALLDSLADGETK